MNSVGRRLSSLCPFISFPSLFLSPQSVPPTHNHASLLPSIHTPGLSLPIATTAKGVSTLLVVGMASTNVHVSGCLRSFGCTFCCGRLLELVSARDRLKGWYCE